MFSLPTGGSAETVEGKSDALPIEIPGVTKVEMESFLAFVYFGYACVLRTSPLSVILNETWTSSSHPQDAR